MTATIPTEVQEAGPPPGLTEAEAKRRRAAGLGNAEPPTAGDWAVIRRNLFSYFNVVLFSLIAALLVIGDLRDGLFVGAVVTANVVLATLQELVATHRLRELRAITAPTANVVRDGRERTLAGADVVQGDLVVLRRGDQVVADGRLLDGEVEVDQSLLTGESNTARMSAGDELRSGVFAVAGECRYEVEQVGAQSYAARLSAQARELVHRVTPLMLRFNRLLRVLLVLTALLAIALFIQLNVDNHQLAESLRATTATVTTIVPVGLLLGITVVIAVGALRVSRSGAIVQDIYAVEALNYVDVIAFDKTGTVTSNRLVLDKVHWAPGRQADAGWLAAFAAAAGTESPTGAALASALAEESNGAEPGDRVAFRSDRRWSAQALSLEDERRVFVLGAPEVLLAACAADVGLSEAYADASAGGLRGLIFAEATALPEGEGALADLTPLALLTLADELRPEIREAFALMERLEITPKVISGDHPRTVVGLLAQLGLDADGVAAGTDLEALDDTAFEETVERTMVFGRVAPEMKARIVAALKRRGHFVAMVGDGANDVLALREADVAVAMASGTGIARGVSGIVLLGDSFNALIRGTREATFVLGNTGRLAKLFIAKSVYTYVLILATNLLGLQFPFLPRQGGVVSVLSLGIPALLVAMSTPPPSATRDFTMRILRFALPAGVALGVSAMTLQLLVEGVLGQSVQESRTLVSLTLTVVGLAYFVEVLGLEDASPRVPWRPLFTAIAAIILLAVLVAVVRTAWIREFFAFSDVSGIGWTSVGVASVAALIGQYLLARHWHRLLDWLIARPSGADEPRGRAL